SSARQWPASPTPRRTMGSVIPTCDWGDGTWRSKPIGKPSLWVAPTATRILDWPPSWHPRAARGRLWRITRRACALTRSTRRRGVPSIGSSQTYPMSTLPTNERGHSGGAEQAAEKRFPAVILSEAKNLALRIFTNIRVPSSPAAPQDDSFGGFSAACEGLPFPALREKLWLVVLVLACSCGLVAQAQKPAVPSTTV